MFIFYLTDILKKKWNQKGKEAEISSCWALWLLAGNYFFWKKSLAGNSKHHLFSPIQTPIILAQRTETSEGPVLSYWENHLNCWHASRENSVDPYVYTNHSLSFQDSNHYHFYETNRILIIDMQMKAPTVATLFIFNVLCQPEFWKAFSNLIYNTFDEFD